MPSSDQDPVVFDRASGQRIIVAVKRVEGDLPTNRQGDRGGTVSRPVETIWARLTDDDGEDPILKFSWEELARENDAWITKSNGRTGTFDDDFPALAPINATAAVDDIVLLRRVMNKDSSGDSPEFKLQWQIIKSGGLPPGGLKFMVLQRPDDLGQTAVWDYVRAVEDVARSLE